MSSLKSYVKGLKDTTWTDAMATTLDTIPDVGTWTDTRAGYLDVLAGGSLGFKPIATYGYSGDFNWYGGSNSVWARSFTVSVIDYTACFVNVNSHNTGRLSSVTSYLTSNTTGIHAAIKNEGGDSDFGNYYGVSVTQFG
jgi:hypothetical protein